MNRLAFIFVISLLATNTFAQNLQTHYDLGKDRKFLTTTVEMFKPDKHGSTFFFIDMNYGDSDIQGVSMAYWEIARAWTIGKSPFAAHIEYNGGLGQNTAGAAYQINNAYLCGFEYSWNAKDFSKGFTLEPLFKSIRGKNKASFQLTGVWYLKLLNNKILFNGFFDIWKEDNAFGTETTKFVIFSEPQLWYNFYKNFAVGSELELAYNFTGNTSKGFHANPTIALKYSF